MTITERNLDGYGAPTIEWARVKAVLDGQLTQGPGSGGPQRHTAWLTSINPDGSPHVTLLTAEFSAPSAGPAPWHVYRLKSSTVFAFGTAEPFGATKFQLD
jgi:hypothetical protein